MRGLLVASLAVCIVGCTAEGRPSAQPNATAFFTVDTTAGREQDDRATDASVRACITRHGAGNFRTVRPGVRVVEFVGNEDAGRDLARCLDALPAARVQGPQDSVRIDE